MKGSRNVFLDRYASDNNPFIPDKTITPSIIVALPAYVEESLVATLTSLSKCTPASQPTLVLILINEPDDATTDHKSLNARVKEEVMTWIEGQVNNHIYFKVGRVVLPTKKAGAGLARKIVMDAAVRQFELANKNDGIIVCLDADCTVSKNYLQAIEQMFDRGAKGCHLMFEHPISTASDPIILYELRLRYYVNALRYAGYPLAFQTVGSSMAVRNDIYQKAGGMNIRKAGEDFYFLQKIIPLGDFHEVHEATVYPSARSSFRVPFGTGKAIMDFESGKDDLHTYYAFEAFVELKSFIHIIPDLFRMNEGDVERIILHVEPLISDYLLSIDGVSHIQKIKKSSTTERVFLQKFYHWFNSFALLKYFHFCRDQLKLENQSLKQEVDKLLHHIHLAPSTNTFEQLTILRKHDKMNPQAFRGF